MSTSDRILGTLVRKGGGKLIDSAITRLLPDKDEPKARGANILRGVAGTRAMRVATRSVPGAIVVASGALAKKLYDRRRARRTVAGKKAQPDT